MAVNDTIIELRGASDGLAPQIDGVKKFLRIEQESGTSTELNAVLTDLERRFRLQNAVIEAANALVADGYPDLPARRVPPEVLADLTDDRDDMNAALKHFAAVERAVALGLTAGAPETK